MYSLRALMTLALCSIVLTPVMADEASDARQAFDRIVTAINEKSFEPVKATIDRAELSRRVNAVRPSAPQSRQALENQFWEMAEHFFWVSVPVATRDRKLETVHFEFENGKGFAVLRVAGPDYTFAYSRIEFGHDSRGRLKIVDVVPFNARPPMSVDMADYMATFQPTRVTTRALMTAKDLSEEEVFQISELLKAYRDKDGGRYFRIYDALDKRLQDEELLLRFNLLLAMYANDTGRAVAFLRPFVEIHEERNRFSVALADMYIVFGELGKAYDALLQFKQHYQLDEGATPARLSALALALGDLESAATHAVEATKLEPSLELGWWSLLRARAAAADFAGALEALTALEDDFEHRLDAAKLRRDPYRAFGALAASQEFKDWRTARD